MGFYNVVKPCVVGKLHYARPTTQPIEVDDDTAAPLVESGCLTPYRPGGDQEPVVYERTEQDRRMGEGLAQALEVFVQGTSENDAEPSESDAGPEQEAPPRPRGRRRSTED